MSLQVVSLCHSFFSCVTECFLQVSKVACGGAPDGVHATVDSEVNRLQALQDIVNQVAPQSSEPAVVPVPKLANSKAPRRAVKAALSDVMVPSRKWEEARKQRVEAEVCSVEEHNDLCKHSRTHMDDASRISSYLARQELQGQYVDWCALRLSY